MTSEVKVDSSEIGDNLSLHSGLQVIKSETIEDLTSLLKSIKFPFTIVTIGNNANLTRFYAVINASRPIKIRKK